MKVKAAAWAALPVVFDFNLDARLPGIKYGN